jgi:FkbM family methyltransferase
MHKLTTFQTVAYEAVIDSESGVAHFLNDTAFFEEFYSLVVGPNDNVIDVGFNIGMQTELLLPLTTGVCYGFEASTKIYQHALEKYKHNPRVILFNVAVSNVQGKATFIDTDVWGAGSLNYTAGMEYCSVGEGYSTIEVDLVTIDEVLAQVSNIGLIKLDIEGAEILALEGAQHLIKRNRPFMVMEYCHNALSFQFRGQDINSTTLFDYAKELGYKVYNIYGICLSNITVWNTSIFKDTSDVFLIPDEQHERWVNELLPVYQYKIYDKILARMEKGAQSPHYFMLTALPSRIYDCVNNRSMSQSMEYMADIQQQLNTSLESRTSLFTTKKLTRRAEVLLALIYDGQLTSAYQLGSIKELTASELTEFELQLS